MRIRFGWLVVFSLIALPGFAQDIPGSIYSSYGFGDLRERSSAYSRAMGYTSIGVRSEYNLNATNPAALTAMVSPVTSFFEIGANYGTTYTNTTSASSTSKFGNLTGINYWFRPHKIWGSMFGVSPTSNLSYSVFAPKVLGSGQSVTVQSTGTGGINQFYWSNSVDVLKNFSVGANVSYYLGNVSKNDYVPATLYTGIFQANRQLTANGINVDFGIQYSIDIKKTKLVLGAVYDIGAHLSGITQTSLINPITFDTLSITPVPKTHLSSRLPPVYGFGFSINRKRSTLAFDGRYFDWKTANFGQGSSTDQSSYVYQNSVKVSGGYEWRGELGSYTYLKTISYRAGAWMQNYPVEIQGTKLTTWGYTLGLAFPIQNNRASVALNYSFTQNGATQKELVREQSRKLSVDVIFRDIWGQKRRLD